jgi:hypothetical protein
MKRPDTLGGSAWPRVVLLLAPMVLLSGCYVTASRRVVPPEMAGSCPDFSGAYHFPGGENAGGVCAVLHDYRGNFRWPHPKAGFAEMHLEFIFVLEQDECRSLEFNVLHLAAGRPIVRRSERSLVRRYRRNVISWGEDSLRFKDRIEPLPSFTLAPVNVVTEEFFLRKEQDGALTYQATSWWLTEGESVLTYCTLPPATDDDWRSAGVESLKGRFAAVVAQP